MPPMERMDVMSYVTELARRYNTPITKQIMTMDQASVVLAAADRRLRSAPQPITETASSTSSIHGKISKRRSADGSISIEPELLAGSAPT